MFLSICIFIVAALFVAGFIYLSRSTKKYPEGGFVEKKQPDNGTRFQINQLPDFPAIKLNIKSIIRWEQMTGKSFHSIDYENEEDVKQLLYCCLLSSSARSCTYDEFKLVTANEAFLKKFLKDIDKNSRIAGQFQKKQDEPGAAGADPAGSPGFIKDMIFMLLIEGAAPDYLLHDAELCDVLDLIAAYEQRERKMLSNARLWTYLSIIPHIDSRKCKSPDDLIKFPWENGAAAAPAADEIEKEKQMFRFFKEHGKDIFKN